MDEVALAKPIELLTWLLEWDRRSNLQTRATQFAHHAPKCPTKEQCPKTIEWKRS